MRKITVLTAAALLIAAGLFVHRQLSALSAVSKETLELERSLALPGMLALASINVAALVEIDAHVTGASDPQTLPPVADVGGDDSWMSRLARVGIDPRRDITHLIAAAYTRNSGELEGELGYALSLSGSFSPAKIESVLAHSPEIEHHELQIHGERVFEVTITDRTTCEPLGPFALHVAPGRILISDRTTLETILARLPHSERTGEVLARFHGFRVGQFISAAVFVPDELPSNLGHPMAGFAANASKEQLEGFRAIYVGAAVGLLPPSLKLKSVLEADDDRIAREANERWSSALSKSQNSFLKNLPTLAALHDTLEIDADRRELQLSARLDAETAGQLKRLPGEMLGMVLGGAAAGFISAGAADAVEEQIDEKPLEFAAQQSVEALAEYDSKRAFAGPVDQTSGPFGIRLSTLALPADPTLGPEIAIEAIGTGLSGIGDRGERAQLEVTSVRSRSGAELLELQVCGTERNDLPIAMTEQAEAGVLHATKRVRLRAGARANDIARIEGHVRLRYPTRTETVSLPAAQTDAEAIRGGARLALTKVEAHSFSWSLSGRSAALLHLRALNEAGRPLLRQGSSHTGSLFGSAISGSADYAGRVSQLEVIFAVEEEVWEFPFALTGSRPGTGGEQTGGPAIEFVDFPLAKLTRSFGESVERIAHTGSNLNGSPSAQAGPFRVSLERIWSFGGLMPRFEVHAPPIPNLEHNLGALEFSLSEIRLRDGTLFHPPRDSFDPGWRQLLGLQKAWGEAGLSGGLSLETEAQGASEDVSSLSGAIVLRMPRRTSTLTLNDVQLGSALSAPGFSAVVSELGRDHFAIRSTEGGEKLLAIQAFNADGERLWTNSTSAERTPSFWLSHYQVRGVTHRLEIVVADELESATYPFRLETSASI